MSCECRFAEIINQGSTVCSLEIGHSDWELQSLNYDFSSVNEVRKAGFVRDQLSRTHLDSHYCCSCVAAAGSCVCQMCYISLAKECP